MVDVAVPRKTPSRGGIFEAVPLVSRIGHWELYYPVGGLEPLEELDLHRLHLESHPHKSQYQ